jgi:predicted anti-sigma-YlaC factor YlaD
VVETSGNQEPPPRDYGYMACEQWREVLSAQLDGEDDPAGRELVDEHLAGCAGCREWLDRAAAVNRLTRTTLVTGVPDLTGSILSALGVDPEADQPIPAAASRAGASAGGAAGLGAVAGVAASRGDAGRSGPPAVGVRRRLAAGVTHRLGEGVTRRQGVTRRLAEGVTRRLGEGWRPRLATLLFGALALVGVVQLIMGLKQVGGGASSQHAHTGLDATPGHLWHESAAWNVAVGAGYLFIALRRTRPTGLMPMLTAFVGMLLLMSVNDLSGARVDAERLVSHGFVILGYLIVAALSRVSGAFVPSPGDKATPGAAWHLIEDEDPEDPPSPARLRLVPRGPLTATTDLNRAASIVVPDRAAAVLDGVTSVTDTGYVAPAAVLPSAGDVTLATTGGSGAVSSAGGLGAVPSVGGRGRFAPACACGPACACRDSRRAA